MNRSSTDVRGFSPFYDQAGATMGRGGQIVWSKVTDEFYLSERFTVKLNGAVAVGASSLTVDALAKSLKAGQFIRGADVPTVAVAVTASALINAVTVSVTALTGGIPSGASIDLGGGKSLKLSAAAITGDTTLNTVALAKALSGTETGTYQGGENNIEVLADVAAGATTISVGNIQFPMADNTELQATSTGGGKYKKILKGTIMVRDSDGFLFPRAAVTTGAETAIGFLASDADEGSRSDAKSGYGLVIGGTQVWENMLPDCNSSGDISGTYKTELAANGVIVQYRDYYDSRVV